MRARDGGARGRGARRSSSPPAAARATSRRPEPRRHAGGRRGPGAADPERAAGGRRLDRRRQRIASNILQNLLTVERDGAGTSPSSPRRCPRARTSREGPLRVTFRLRPEATLVGRRAGDDAPTSPSPAHDDGPAQPDREPRRAGTRSPRITPGRTAAGGTCAARHLLHGRLPRRLRALARRLQRRRPATSCCREHVLKGKDFNTVWNTGGIVGSGPFTLRELRAAGAGGARAPTPTTGARAGGRRPFLDRIVINFLDSPAAAVTALRQGEAQMASLTARPRPDRRADAIDGVAVQAVPSLFFEHLILNTQAAPLDDPAVRQALAYAIDRAAGGQRAARRLRAGAPERAAARSSSGTSRPSRLRVRPRAGALAC